MIARQRHSEWRRLTGPQALAARPEGLLLTAASLLALGLIFLLEWLTSSTIVVGVISFIPVLLSVWLLSTWLAAAVTITALALRLAAIFFAGIDPITVFAEAVALAVIAGLGRFAAVTLSAFWAAEALAEDRKRIARELHDGTIQSLFGVGIGLRGASARSRDPSVQAGIHEAVSELDHVMRDLRNYVFGLRPGTVLAQPLGQILEELSHDLEMKTSIRTLAEIDYMVAAQLTRKADDLIQFTREALSNVGRHSQARTCQVGLRRDGKSAVVEIRDDGNGFDVTEVHGRGQGLLNMRERAARLGGQTTVQSSASKGTTVRLILQISGRRARGRN